MADPTLIDGRGVAGGVAQPVVIMNQQMPQAAAQASGAATSARQDTGNTSLASIDTKIPASPSTAGNQTTGNTSLASIDTKLTAGVPTTDNGPAWTSVFGVGGVPFASADQHSAVASVTDAPTTSQKLVITDLIVSVDTAMNVTFKEETSGTVMFGPWYLAANTTLQVSLRGKKKLPVANKKLQVITSVAGNITVQAGYYSEA